MQTAAAASRADLTRPNEDHREARADHAAAVRWTPRLDILEAVANHFSYAVDDTGRRFLMNPNLRHFARMRASDMLLLDADDPETMDRPDAPDATAWHLHGSIHRACPHARCVMHVHSTFATVLACLQDCELPPVDQSSAMFFRRQAIDTGYGGLALEEEGERCAALLQDPKKKIMVMGNHGVLAIGDTIGETFNRMYYFERACETYIRALQTGMPLRRLSDEVAEKTAQEVEGFSEFDGRYLEELRAILDSEGSDYAC